MFKLAWLPEIVAENVKRVDTHHGREKLHIELKVFCFTKSSLNLLTLVTYVQTYKLRANLNYIDILILYF